MRRAAAALALAWGFAANGCGDGPEGAVPTTMGQPTNGGSGDASTAGDDDDGASSNVSMSAGSSGLPPTDDSSGAMPIDDTNDDAGDGTTLEPPTTSSSTGELSMGSGSESSSDGAPMHPFQGAYNGTFSGDCPDFSIGGTLQFTVAADGSLAGTVTEPTFMITTNLAGNVDGAGSVNASANVIVDNCPFTGTINGAGAATGNFSCGAGECSGVWNAA